MQTCNLRKTSGECSRFKVSVVTYIGVGSSNAVLVFCEGHASGVSTFCCYGPQNMQLGYPRAQAYGVLIRWTERSMASEVENIQRTAHRTMILLTLLHIMSR
ncbi:hypothetical protein SEVIR_5G012600v4 [Setaria viridis]|uniref:Uncharacterized protein n=2 Tax=Setaria TaxID=4554 RepID=A0A368R0C0_SETIT|nr:hypothetical protein SETIT_5G013900v2 [Setaria italica]TKW12073.1 hypothetical protein SEVIR_5G012600v2 [Setaria viridis]